MSHPDSDGQEVSGAGDTLSKKSFLDHFQEAPKPAGLVAHESKCPVLRPELVKSENTHLFDGKWRVIEQ